MVERVGFVCIICLFLLPGNERGAQLGDPRQLNRILQTSIRLMDEGNVDRAIIVGEQALALAQATRTQYALGVALSENNLAIIYKRKGDYPKAENFYLRCISSLEQTLGPADASVGFAKDNLGGLYRETGEYKKAESVQAEAQQLLLKALGDKDPEYAICLNNLGNLYYFKGEFRRAEGLYAQAQTIVEDREGHGSARLAPIFDNLALLYLDTGDFDRAELWYKRSLAIFEAQPDRDRTGIATAFNNLALLYTAKGDYNHAEPLLLQAKALIQQALGSRHPDYAMCLDNLAKVYLAERAYGKAEELFRESVAILDAVYGSASPRIATSLHNLAEMYRAEHEYTKAETLLLRAIAIKEAALGLQHPSLAASLNSLAALYEQMEQYDKAKELYLRAVRIQEAVGPLYPELGLTMENLGTLYWTLGETSNALHAFVRCNEIREYAIRLVLATGSEQQKRSYLNTAQANTDGTITFHVNGAPTSPDALRLAILVALQRKGRLVDAVAGETELLRRRLNSGDRRLLDQLLSTRGQLAALSRRTPLRDGLAELRDEVGQLKKQEEALEQLLSARSAEVRAVEHPVSIQDIQSAIPIKAALIELVSYKPFNVARQSKEMWGRPRYVAYVLFHSGEPKWVDLGEAEPIDQLATRLRTVLGNSSRTDFKEVARQMDHAVMEPIRRLLGDTRQLLIAPDGQLNLVPFAALVDQDGHYLVERYTISYLGSGRDLLRLQAPTVSRGTPLVLANPDFDHVPASMRPNPPQSPARGSSAGPPTAPESTKAAVDGSSAVVKNDERRSADLALGFTPLPGTASEAKALKQLMPDARVLTDQQASKEVLQQASGPRVLHIATHGFFLADQPKPSPEGLGIRGGVRPDDTVYELPPVAGENPLLRSGLALAGANLTGKGNKVDGILTALEATGLDLWGTQLVVLSACETGVGDVHNGDGVYGLRRALVLAGSRTQVMSMWKVSDSATRDLMAGY